MKAEKEEVGKAMELTAYNIPLTIDLELAVSISKIVTVVTGAWTEGFCHTGDLG